MAKKKPDKSREAKKANLITDQALALAEYGAQALMTAQQLRIKNKAVAGLSLPAPERIALAPLPGLSAKVKKKLTKPDADLTIAEVGGMVMAVAQAFLDAAPKEQVSLLLVAKKLTECLQKNVLLPDVPAKAKKPTPADTVYQFKITLRESYPPIWRRIQIKDCTLDQLHEHIQTAMGWTNSHLHHFKLGEQLYGNPELLQDNFEELEYKDSTTTKIRDILPRNARRFRFVYEYDFGDSWNHEVLWEGVVRAEPKATYPLCLEGARACPPEDCGGIWNYPDFVEAIQNPENERHGELLEWVGGKFDPEEFDPVKATKAMQKGLADWRSMAGW